MNTNELTYDQRPSDLDFGPTVLIVDDLEMDRNTLRLACESVETSEPIRLLEASNIPDALKVIASTPIHVVLLDKNLGRDDKDPHQNGIEAVPEMLRLKPQMQILMVTGSNEIQDAVRAMTLGAFGYVVKKSPPSLLVAQINKAIEMASLALQKIVIERSTNSTPTFEIVGNSKQMKFIRSQVPGIAESNRPVLVLGENGTGKTIIAQIINQHRKRYLKQKDRPFFDLNIGAISPELVESELFGTEPGAFTGAKAKVKPGFIELANNGTLFLDEIGEASPEVQVKLLKVLDQGIFFRVGGTTDIHSNFKLICATNKNLEELVAQEKFREDLYMRISTFCIRVPSLVERKEDIPEIVRTILPGCSRANNVRVKYEDLPQDFIQYLMDKPPRGNFRGIDHQLSRLLALSDRDKHGRPVLSTWKTIPEFTMDGARALPNDTTLDLDTLMRASLNVIGPKFPGLNIVLDSVSERIMLDARSKFTKNVQIAEALKLSEGAVSMRLRGLGKARTKKSKLKMVQSKAVDGEVVQ